MKLCLWMIRGTGFRWGKKNKIHIDFLSVFYATSVTAEAQRAQRNAENTPLRSSALSAPLRLHLLRRNGSPLQFLAYFYNKK